MALRQALPRQARPAQTRTLAAPALRQPVRSRQAAVRVKAVAEMSPDLKQSIDELINANKIVVFMKGTRQFPQCGFSNTVVQILNVMEVPYETVNILADDRLRRCILGEGQGPDRVGLSRHYLHAPPPPRSGMKEYSQWPTFPQVYINGEFFGGCDIMIETYQSGELKEQLEIALNS
ncbi:hypothetical protein HYH03_008493 [Edaphochlamys debaryana]|uniref:Glutaredoxin domain-containing protein n=1 Tax=Edaphochlamys debaryana TaxID=47281 RepID=A0A836BYA0_9CHLO|nr:hypothetical protein HYH03_008493 [Edaphochlamys debaryana]|eukprot:KAG2493360.1 hypothetical protein HYH03_008493 [Edaphochlamys debaryana]